MISAFVSFTPLVRAPLRALRPLASSRPHLRRTVATAQGEDDDSSAPSNINIYNDWVAKKDPSQVEQTSSALHTKVSAEPLLDTPGPPPFEPFTLFHDGAEAYAAALSTPPSTDYVNIAARTAEAEFFAPCMVGALEGQFLKMVAQIKRARRVLDVGTFTGYSALAFADAIASDPGAGADAKVVTIEADGPTAQVARECFASSTNGGRVELIEGDARGAMEKLRAAGAKFDIVFLDADKVNYQVYYEIGLDMLETDGILMADNALCSLIFKKDDPSHQALHDFAQHVRADSRVEQVMLTVREGVLVVRKV